jgi:protein-disulfide isomerase
MKNLPLLLGSLVLTFAAVVGVSLLFTKKANEPIVPVDMARAVGDARHAQGSASASATLVEFSDMQCPACKAAEPYVKQILEKYGDAVRFVYRQYPLQSIHIHATEGAIAAEAAGKQNAFFQYRDKLFETQETWAAENDPNSLFIQYAKDLKLNVEQFQKDIKDKSMSDVVMKDVGDGDAIGVNSTPTFFVNGIKTDLSEVDASLVKVLNQGK